MVYARLSAQMWAAENVNAMIKRNLQCVLFTTKIQFFVSVFKTKTTILWKQAGFITIILTAVSPWPIGCSFNLGHSSLYDNVHMFTVCSCA